MSLSSPTPSPLRIPWIHWGCSWEIDREKMETVSDFIFGGSKIAADGDCSHEIKTLTPWKESYDQPRQHIKNQRHYFANKCLSSQGYGFMYGCESWTIRKAAHWRIDAFELWCWRRLLRVPWTARKSNQSILRETSPLLEGLILKPKRQYFGHLMWRADLFEKTLMLGKSEGRRRRGRQRMRWLDGITDSMDRVWVDSGSWWWTGRPGVLGSWGRKASDMTEQLNWTGNYIQYLIITYDGKQS